MFYLKKVLRISAAHHLNGYDGPCANPHGHNWKITVFCEGLNLDKVGMLVDFVDIKKVVMEYDHINLNEHPDFKGIQNTTAENIARQLHKKIPHCWKVVVEETDGSEVCYQPE